MLAELEEVVEYKLAPERRSTIRDMWWKRLQVLYCTSLPSHKSVLRIRGQFFFTPSHTMLYVLHKPPQSTSSLHEKPPEPQKKPIFFPVLGPFGLSWTRIHQSKYCKYEGSRSETLTVYLSIQEIFLPFFGRLFGFSGPGSISLSIVNLSPCGSGSETHTGLPDYSQNKKILFPFFGCLFGFP